MKRHVRVDTAGWVGVPGAIFGAVVIAFAYWLWVWPLVVEFILHQRWLQMLRWRIGLLALISTGLWAGAFAAAAVYGGGQSWSNVQVQVGSLALSGAVSFTYGSLLPPAFSARFMRIRDENSGTLEQWPHLVTIDFEAGQFTHLVLAVFNTGLATWGAYRINVQFPSGFELSLDDPGRTEPDDVWDWSTLAATLGRDPPWVQVDRSQPLVAGEPHILRFWVRAPQAGDYQAQIVVGCAGRYGEMMRRLDFTVADGAENRS